jgi:hypothetical protein
MISVKIAIDSAADEAPHAVATESAIASTTILMEHS